METLYQSALPVTDGRWKTIEPKHLKQRWIDSPHHFEATYSASTQNGRWTKY